MFLDDLVKWSDEFPNYTFNIVHAMYGVKIESYIEEIMKLDNKYNLEINEAFYPKKFGPFTLKEKSVYDILENELKSYGYGISDIVEDLKMAGLGYAIYRKPKALSTRQQLILSLFIEIYKKKKHIIISEDMFMNDDSFMTFTIWLLKKIRKVNGTIIWLTKKTLDEIDDMCDKKIKYTSDTCFYKLAHDLNCLEMLPKRKQQVFNIEYKEINYSFNEDLYDLSYFIPHKISDLKKLEFLKTYLKRYNVDLIDIYLTEENGVPFLYIGIVGYECLMVIYDILKTIKILNGYRSESTYTDFMNSFKFLDGFYITRDEEYHAFLIRKDESDYSMQCPISELPYTPEELLNMRELTFIEYKGVIASTHKRIKVEDKENEILEEYQRYQENNRSNKSIIQGYPKYKILDLNDKNVEYILRCCLAVSDTPKSDIFYADIFTERCNSPYKPVAFSKQRLALKKLEIRYLLGQLACVHEGMPVIEISDAKRKYDNTTGIDKLTYYRLLHLGYAVNLFPQFDLFDDKRVKAIIRNIPGLRRTLSPNDLYFNEWWEEHKGEWHK